MVSGPWDFAGLLFAASGFLLFGGPALLSSLSFNETWRRFWLLGKDTPGITQEDRLLVVRLALFVLYFVLVVGGAAFLLWRRRRMTAIYNVDPIVVETVLGQVLERWQLPFVQTGNVLTFEPSGDCGLRIADRGLKASALNPQSAIRNPQFGETLPVHLVEQTTTLAVDVSPAMCHVTLTWNPAESPLRREVEGQLERV